MPNLSPHQLANDTARFRFRLLFSQHKIDHGSFSCNYYRSHSFSWIPIMVVIISTTSEHWVRIYDAERDRSINVTVNDINGMVTIPKHLQTIFASAREYWIWIYLPMFCLTTKLTASRALISVGAEASWRIVLLLLTNCPPNLTIF